MNAKLWSIDLLLNESTSGPRDALSVDQSRRTKGKLFLRKMESSMTVNADVKLEMMTTLSVGLFCRIESSKQLRIIIFPESSNEESPPSPNNEGCVHNFLASVRSINGLLLASIPPIDPIDLEARFEMLLYS